MAHSRLERIGTIYSRISGIIKAGAMKLQDRPLWFEVYQAFPPKYPPQYDRPFPAEPVKNLYYPEDIIRAKFYKAMKNAPVTNLVDRDHQTLSQKCITLCMNFQKEENLSLEEAFEKALNSIKASAPKGTEKEEKHEEETTKEKLEINVKDLFDK